MLLSDAAQQYEQHNVATLDPAAPKLLVLGGDSPEAIIVAARAALERLGHKPESAEAEFGALLLATVAAERAQKTAAAPRFALCLVCSAATLKKELELAANGVATAAASGRNYASVAGSCFAPKPLRSKQVAILERQNLLHPLCLLAQLCRSLLTTLALPLLAMAILTGGLHVRRWLEPVHWAGARPAPHRALGARVCAARHHRHVDRQA